jgi:hypothetical protein
MNSHQSLGLNNLSLASVAMASKLKNKDAITAASNFPSVIAAVNQGNYEVAAILIEESITANRLVGLALLKDLLKVLGDN